MTETRASSSTRLIQSAGGVRVAIAKNSVGFSIVTNPAQLLPSVSHVHACIVEICYQTCRSACGLKVEVEAGSTTVALVASGIPACRSLRKHLYHLKCIGIHARVTTALIQYPSKDTGAIISFSLLGRSQGLAVSTHPDQGCIPLPQSLRSYGRPYMCAPTHHTRDRDAGGAEVRETDSEDSEQASPAY